MKHKFLFFLSFLLLGIILTSCTYPGTKPTATLDIRVIHTQVAGTLIAERIQQAEQEAVAKLTEIAQATSTATSLIKPTDIPITPSATPTQEPTYTPIIPSPTVTVIPPTPIPPTPIPPTPIPPTSIPPTPIPPTPIPGTSTPKPVPCNWAMFVKDISAPDGTSFIAGTQFTKTWRVQNIGTCKWTREYAMVYQSGELMGAAKIHWLEDAVQPGGTVDISVTLTAPSGEGKHIGYWKLRDQNNNHFGMGKDANEAFWVQINVANPSSVAYNFSNHICDATWRTKDGPIPCSPDLGSVERIESPKLETGHKEAEVAIVVHPNIGEGGFISGKFPQRKILSGDWFRVVVGCMVDNPKCNVTFKLDYQINNGAIHSLGTWKQTYDGKIQNIDIDLTFLAGNRVVFIFTVQNNGSSEGDWGFWLFPRIAR